MKYLPFSIIIIIILFMGILNFYSNRNTKDNNKSIGVVKGISDNNSPMLPELKDIVVSKIPQKITNYNNPIINAKNYILIEQNSNYPLAEKDSHVRVPIASTTKVMTAIISLESYDLNDIVTVSKNASSQIGSEVYLLSDEKIKVIKLLNALLVQSGNDAAMALAEFMPNGGKDEFVRKMNVKAEYLGLHDTLFKDPAGLDDSGYSSAFDLAIITSYALNNSTFREIIKTPEISINSEDNSQVHILKSSNRLIKDSEPLYYPNAIGVKTGFTSDAGHCLISAAINNNILLIGVVLNTVEYTNDASAKESKKLLEWGYNSFQF